MGEAYTAFRELIDLIMAGNLAVGYAYYTAFRSRAAYAHSVESTIYLSQHDTGQGFGRPLYEALIAFARARGFRELLGVIALPNPASIALHEALGFREAGLPRRAGLSTPGRLG